jgi:hypothetical protein
MIIQAGILGVQKMIYNIPKLDLDETEKGDIT